MDTNWLQGFFDREYLRLWAGSLTAERTQKEADGIWNLLKLRPSSRVLDAPCGYGRLSLALAERGAIVVGVDLASDMIAEAERNRRGIENLRYLEHDLRTELPEDGFDAAFNVFTSLGYGTEEDDVKVLRTLAAAVRPGGKVLVESNHRDLLMAYLSRGNKPSDRLPDGTLIIEEPNFDSVKGVMNTAWYWSGPSGSGKKTATLRVYTITELVRMMDKVGLRLISAHAGLSTEPFEIGKRCALVAEKLVME
jgi:SAM-dependent methyltransferase